ncbi:multidrug transporter [Flavobacteriaceae bacterium CRH]|nr:multidrug transporter [Flavobacteriaceae bacterium CRH]
MKTLLLQAALFLCSYFAMGQKTLFTPTEWSNPSNEFYNNVSNSRKYESTNFVLYWGDKVGTDPSTYSDASLRFIPRSVADTLETSFKRYVTDLKFVSNAPTTNMGKYKIIIMMMNTWNSTDGRLQAFAQASSFSNTIGAMFVHPEATKDGGALSHEFAHTLQMMMHIQENPGNGTAFSGYDWAGPFFEGHANFMRAQAYSQWAEIDGTLTRWIQTRNFMWSSNRHHYTNFHLMYYVQEKEGFDFTRRMWAESKNQEHPLETIKRLKGFTQDQLDDYLWGYAQRQPAFDYPIQWTSQINNTSNFGKKIRETYALIKSRMPRYTSRQYTLLTKVAGTTDQYYTNNDWAPQDYGMNIIPLYPTCTGTQKQVSIKFKGHTEVNPTQAGWRYGFVTTKTDGTISRYSPMYKTDGEASFTLDTATEANIFLVVFSAPKVHVNYNMDEGYPKQRRYPYELKIANANPEGFQPAADFRKFLKTNGRIHTNGGGWISNSASVAASVYVGPYAIVRSGTISGNARIDGYAMVEGGNISGNAIVRDNACVYNATLTSNAIVEGNAWMEGGSVANTANIKGNAMLFAGNFGGAVVVGGDAEIGSCSTAGVYLQFPYWRNGRAECDGKGATDVSNIDINPAFTNFSAASMAFSVTPTCTVATLSTNKSILESEAEVGLSIFPNPTAGNLTISFLQVEQEKVNITLFDINGRKIDVITNQSYDAGRIEIPYNSSKLIKGVYLLRIQTGKTVVNKSFIKQ